MSKAFEEAVGDLDLCEEEGIRAEQRFAESFNVSVTLSVFSAVSRLPDIMRKHKIR